MIDIVLPDKIDANNFHEYFQPIETGTYKKGKVIARYRAKANLVNGKEKLYLINLLINKDKAIAASNYMKNTFKSSEKDSYSIPIQIASDLVSGMAIKDVLEKEYEFQLEILYYTWEELVPLDDPHWQIISFNNLNENLNL